ncbi:hypothetical protein LG047_05885 [Methylocystis sp. WRRC1]|uniref:hypothetical protein n=1 Tax=unclassified Methylocystis TaxID=2625913 RepID=UPI0001F875A5|nr:MULTISPECIES: hypothetical protein [unclassified Methylocystis]MCC3244851.1 hypothetical protein [Methylocystis sp. WRRC1]
MIKAQDSQPIIEILKRVARELDDAAVSVNDLSGMVETSVRNGIARNEVFLRSAQTVDILHQRLEGLSHFVTELAELMPSHWEVESHEAARKLKLSRLKNRLGHSYDGPESGIHHSSGDFELL